MAEKELALSEAYRKEYAEFIDLAVHELDAPLRKLSVLIDRLRISGNPVETDSNYYPRIQTCLSDMRSILRTLNDLSGCSNEKRASQPCDLKKIIQSIIQDIPALEVNGTLTMEGLPIFMADPVQLEMLFRNLLQNAATFSRKDIGLKVDISAKLLPPAGYDRYQLSSELIYYSITVSDNGIGFDEANAERIFEPFVRLYGKSDYPGNGIGLAICRKIVENHQGVIYAESQKNVGSKFILILPQILN